MELVTVLHNRKRTVICSFYCDANFSSTSLTSRFSAFGLTLIAFDLWSCDKHLAVAQVRITDAIGTVRIHIADIANITVILIAAGTVDF